MNSKNEKPHFIRRTTREKQKHEKIHSKMLILILKRVIYQKIKTYFNGIKNNVICETKILTNVVTLAERNIKIIKHFCWQKIIFYNKIKAYQSVILKFTIICSAKYQRHCITVGFKSILNYSNKKLSSNLNKIITSKPKIFINTLLKIYNRKLLFAILKMKNNILKQKSSIFYAKFLFKNIQNIIRQRKMNFWHKFTNLKIGQHRDLQHQLGQLSKQLDYYKKQLMKNEKKNENSRAQSLQRSRRSARSSGSYKKRNTSVSAQKREQENSNAQQNTSILSWINGLNSSFYSIKSGKSKATNGPECYCKYRQKYNKYKAQTASLKNQLEIIKSQLEVTKDLNEHLQQQISNLCTKQSKKNPQFQLLWLQVKQLRKEKQISREKLLNTQKYIANLKSQFKNKIQNIYRNLKRTNN